MSWNDVLGIGIAFMVMVFFFVGVPIIKDAAARQFAGVPLIGSLWSRREVAREQAKRQQVIERVQRRLELAQAKQAPQPARATAGGSGVRLPSPPTDVVPVGKLTAQDARLATTNLQTTLPATTPLLPSPELDAIPLLYDGHQWATLSLRHSAANGGDLVICGAKRWGKGNAAQLIALQILQLGPTAAEVWILDPKSGLDYGFALRLQHARLYIGGLESDARPDPTVADGSLRAGYDAALKEMFRRNSLMQRTAQQRGTTIRNIEEYNAQARAGEQLPYIAVIADEVADLGKEERAVLCTLVRMAGAAGLVFFVMT